MENANGCKNLTINVSGQTMCIEGITKYTTCDDVIEMVFYNNPMNTDSFALFESSNGVERMLYGKESVLKVIRFWGAEKNSSTLLIRKVDNVRSNMASLSRAKRKLQKIRNLKANIQHLKNHTIQENLDRSCSKNIEPSNQKDKCSKLGLLKRFISDVVLKQMHKKAVSRSTARTTGCYATENHDRSSSEEFELESEFKNRHNFYLNTAFDSNELLFDKSDNDSMSLDGESAFEDDSISELERNIYEMSESNCDEHGDYDSSGDADPFYDLDKTVIKCDRIISMFQKSALNDEDIYALDDCMESFMNTLVYKSDSDDALDFLDSDSE